MSDLTASVAGAFEQHGGEVDRLGNGRVVASFGVPAVHEDDALRALQGAWAALAAAGATAVRVGVASGEALVVDDARPVGNVVLEAEELARRAPAGAVLLSPVTAQLTRGEARVEVAKDGEAGHRLLSLGPAERGPETPFVGRDDELDQLQQAFAGVVRRRSGALVTVFGAAGLGKSRLAAELTRGLRRALVLSARCMPRGERRAFGPLVQIVAELGGPAGLESLLAGVPDGGAVAERLTAAIDGSSPVPVEEMTWASRQLLSTLADERPVVLIVDDLHWAEPAFLDLLESLVDLLRSRPVLIVCFSRPDLLDDRPGWGGGQPNSTALRLEPLSAAQSEALVTARAADVQGADRARVIETAEGNPLFVEQLLASLAEEESFQAPPTIQALLSARLDRLADAQRTIVQSASVVGSEFTVSSVGPLVGVDIDLDTELRALVRKDLVRPAPTASRVDAYRFCHHLIRDVAYATLPRAARATLHERVAGLVENDADAVVGYHLEQAYLHRLEIGVPPPELESLAARASERLGLAGDRATRTYDPETAFDLYGRAALLRPSLSRERALLRLRASMLMTSHRKETHDALVEEAAGIAAVTGDQELNAYIRVVAAHNRLWMDPSYDSDEYVLEVAELQPALASAEPRLAAHSAMLLGIGLMLQGQCAAADRLLGEAARGARDHDPLVWGASVLNRLESWIWGPRTVDDARRGCERLERETARGGPAPTRYLTASMIRTAAICAAMGGAFDEAHRLASDALEIVTELGFRSRRVLAIEALWVTAYLAGDLAAAERITREIVDVVEPEGAQYWLADSLALHARMLCLLGRYDEAEEAIAGIGNVAARNITGTVRAESVRGLLALARGSWDEAVGHARHASELAGRTDCVDVLGDSNEDLAAVLDGVGEATQARDARRAAYAAYARKGHVRALTVRERLATSARL